MDAYDAGLRSHCLRVAAWAHELSGVLKLNSIEERWLEQAALLHHLPLEMLEVETVNRLAGDLWPDSRNHTEATARGPSRIRDILETMRQPGRSTNAGRISAIADIVELA